MQKIFTFTLAFVLSILLFAITSCKTIEMPSIEESQQIIDKYKPNIEGTDRSIARKAPSMPNNTDIVMKAQMPAMNKILRSFAYNRQDDLIIILLKSNQIIKEDKSILGIKYTNYIDIDTGYVKMDFKALQFDKFEKNTIFATIEIEGKGNIAVSGKYTGIPASVSSELKLYLKESVIFDILPTDSGYIILKPRPKELKLKARLGVNLLKWQVPWNQDIPLNLTDLISPISVPLALSSQINFPLPARDYKKEKIDYIPYILKFKDSKILAEKNRIEFQSKIGFQPKK